LRLEDAVSEETVLKFKALIRSRRERIPLAYLLHKAPFWQEELEVGPGCLVPRPETEILIESVIRETGLEKEKKFSLIDLGTGSGAIAIALLRHYPSAIGVLSDRSAEALEYAKRNVKRYGLEDRSECVLSDGFEVWKNHAPRENWELMVTNPPYLSEKDLTEAVPELRHEPRQALDGGKDGLNFYRILAEGLGDFLKPGGWFAAEVGIHQAGPVAEILAATGVVREPKKIKDFAGIERVVITQRVSVNRHPE
jgi:release factor glutamine methyltransferase